MPNHAENDSSKLKSDEYLSGLPEVDGFKVLVPVVIYAKIGQGGMGAVYRGKHLSLDIDVALKCLKTDLAKENEEFVGRFQREAKVAASINSPHLIRVFDVNESDGLHYLVMEFVEGESARERVERKGPLPLSEALVIISGATRGLIAAHAKGIVHRDIKPDNIMISTAGEVKVADLGLAKAGDAIDNLKTQTGLVMGTPTYMPPEQYRDVSSVGPRGDVYALGATLYFLLAGKGAIAPGPLVEVMYRVCTDPFPEIRELRPELPESLSALIKRATAKNPADRFQTAEDLEETLIALMNEYLGDEKPAAVLSDNNSLHAFDEKNLLVSPPPAKTLASIRLKVKEPGGLDAVGDEQKTLKAKEAHFVKVPNKKAMPGAQSKKTGHLRMYVFLALFLMLSLGAALVYSFFEHDAFYESFNESLSSNHNAGNESSNKWSSTLSGPQAVLSKINSDLELEFIQIEAGTFMMGSPLTEEYRREHETLHQVHLTRNFYMAKTELTQGQWQSIMNTSPWSGKDYVKVGDRIAASYLSWDDAQNFCKEFNRRYQVEGWTFRLPTEAEWECCCRAGSQDAYSFGNSYAGLKDYAWFRSNAHKKGEKYPHEVAGKKPNAWGFHDFHGNVWEWCQDWLGAYPPAIQNPQGAVSGTEKVIRGGCWQDGFKDHRSALRTSGKPDSRFHGLGVRLVLAQQ